MVKLYKLYKEIRNRGTDSQRLMLSLLQNENADVRLSTAAWALEFDAQTAVPVLEKIGHEEHNLTGFTADRVLKQWKEGKLRLP
jgi:hypothetical protein